MICNHCHGYHHLYFTKTIERKTNKVGKNNLTKKLNYEIPIVLLSCKTWNFCNQFLRFFKKTIPLKLSLLLGSRPKSARASPHIWLTLFQILSKSVHFRRMS